MYCTCTTIRTEIIYSRIADINVYLGFDIAIVLAIYNDIDIDIWLLVALLGSTPISSQPFLDVLDPLQGFLFQSSFLFIR